MTHLDRVSLDRFLPRVSADPDWDDVMRRSGARRRRRRLIVLAAAAASLAVLTGAASAVDTVRTFFLGSAASPKIAFVSSAGFGREGRLFLVGADGKGKTVVTELSNVSGPPAWSPDGTRIAYERGGNDVYVVDANGRGARKLRPGVPWRSPAWSPDGRTIAVTGPGGIHVVSADTRGGRRLTDHGAWPAWSPDGQKLVFMSIRDGNSEVYVVSADGTGQRNLSRDSADDFMPAWSPDGRTIAFVSTRDGASEIYVVDADGSGLRRVTSDRLAVNSPPSWSPDGTKIVFEGRRRANSNVYVVNADGSGFRNLTRGQGGQPQWSPDGRSIAFRKSGPCGPCPRPAELYVMNADGSDQRNVSRTPRANETWLVWSPGPKRGV